MQPPQPAAAITTINTLRMLAIDAIEAANSGHPGLPLGAAPMAYVLWQRHLQVHAGAPHWPNRDRFVLSAGHGSMLLYGLLHLYGFDVSAQDLRAFRTLGSKTPGHPEFGLTSGVEATTGPLGQGAANSVGMAIAERAMAHRFNKGDVTLIDHRTYALLSDGDIMEGVVHEAASLAGHLRLGRLIWLYDANAVTLDGPSNLSDSEKVADRFSAYGWRVVTVADGDHDIGGLDEALHTARSQSASPTLIIVHTTIGYGAPNKAGSHKSHGAPLGVDEAQQTRAALRLAHMQPFDVPDEVTAHVGEARAQGAAAYKAWQQDAQKYRQAHPDAYAEFEASLAHALPQDWSQGLEQLSTDKPVSTREASGRALNALAKTLPNLLGGDGDLSVSTLSAIANDSNFDGQSGAGRNVRFGVREHAMAAAANGMAYHGGLRPYVATFFVFSDYMRPSLRMAALSRLKVLWVFTHDSVGVGEDGATHQPVEQLMALRVMPHVTVMRPADASETYAMYRAAFAGDIDGPIAMVLGRQSLPTLAGLGHSAEVIAHGAYVVRRAAGKEVGLFIATGSEVHVALEAQATLAAEGTHVRVVSMPSWELFQKQSSTYQAEILPPGIEARISIEAGATLGWSTWLGSKGRAIGIDGFGASGPGPAVLEHFGISKVHAAAAMREILGR